METRITARHFTLNDSLRSHIQEGLDKLGKFYGGITDANVVLSLDKGHVPARREAEIVLSVYRQRLTAKAAEDTHERAIDECTDRLRRQLLKYKSRLRDKQKDVHK